MKNIITLFLITNIIFAAPIDDAKVFFENYIKLEHAFDPASASQYADDAIIKTQLKYPNGEVKELTIPAPQYKALIGQLIPLAKARGDTSSYSEVTFTEEGAGVRIKATRFSNLKKNYSPISILIIPGKSGKWFIHEELSESIQ